jgi:hypothetical protein
MPSAKGLASTEAGEFHPASSLDISYGIDSTN